MAKLQSELIKLKYNLKQTGVTGPFARLELSVYPAPNEDPPHTLRNFATCYFLFPVS